MERGKWKEEHGNWKLKENNGTLNIESGNVKWEMESSTVHMTHVHKLMMKTWSNIIMEEETRSRQNGRAHRRQMLKALLALAEESDHALDEEGDHALAPIGDGAAKTSQSSSLHAGRSLRRKESRTLMSPSSSRHTENGTHCDRLKNCTWLKLLDTNRTWSAQALYCRLKLFETHRKRHDTVIDSSTILGSSSWKQTNVPRNHIDLCSATKPYWSL